MPIRTYKDRVIDKLQAMAEAYITDMTNSKVNNPLGLIPASHILRLIRNTRKTLIDVECSACGHTAHDHDKKGCVWQLCSCKIQKDDFRKAA